jgi:predicted translin family RNA/ssDNA-binding protein
MLKKYNNKSDRLISEALVMEVEKRLSLVNRVKDLSGITRSAAKRAIAFLRKENFEQASKFIDEAEKALKELAPIVSRDPRFLGEGYYREAVEEYAESKIFYTYLLEKKILFPKYVFIGSEEILLGSADVSGELVRRSVSIAREKDARQEIERYKKAIENLSHDMTPVAQGGKLRQKHDEVERNLAKIERILYEIEK